ncbi:GntR family transcriptional regulator [Nocardioides sambongensis]|uniref:GntR family transcriptional regulator n=1 Tax=Nocardioides sambongensis TaxID=2589074 RepID=UPI0018C8BB47|nr:GntR family transcriptional regulator [Nocardioides sambongensis]
MSQPPRGHGAAAVAALEEEIVLGLLHPRERLREDELMERFELKRHVARAVLSDLASLGLVERRPNAGAVVREYSTDEVRDLYQVRELLETTAAASIADPLPTGALEALRATQAEHDLAVSEGDRRRVFRANLRFHEQLFAMAPNAVLVEAVNAHARRAHAIRFTSFADQASLERARTEHHAILEALDPVDPVRLSAVCAAHLLPSRDAYLAKSVDRDRLR